MTVTETELLDNYINMQEDGMAFVSKVGSKTFLWIYLRKDCRKHSAMDDDINEINDRSNAAKILLWDNTRVGTVIDLDETCENHPTLAAIDKDLRMLFGDLLTSGTKITETLLLDGYTGLYRDTSYYASTIEDKEIVWTYQYNGEECDLRKNNREASTGIFLTFNRNWEIALDDTCENHPALAAIDNDLHAIPDNWIAYAGLLACDEEMWKWVFSTTPDE